MYCNCSLVNILPTQSYNKILLKATFKYICKQKLFIGYRLSMEICLSGATIKFLFVSEVTIRKITNVYKRGFHKNSELSNFLFCMILFKGAEILHRVKFESSLFLQHPLHVTSIPVTMLKYINKFSFLMIYQIDNFPHYLPCPPVRKKFAS